MQDEAGLPTALRWGGALAIVLALHATAAWVLLSRSFPPMVMPAASEAVMLDLAPDLPPVQPAAVVPPAVATLPPPPAPPAPIPPPPPIPVPEPPPPAPPLPETPPVPLTPEPPPPPELPPVELPPTPPVAAEVVLPVPPPPPPPPPLRPQPPPPLRPQPKPKPRVVERPVERQPAPPVADETPRPVAPAPVQAAPVQAARVQAAPAQPSARPPAPASAVTPSWRSELLGRLQRAKRYPDLARSHGDQGVATVTFAMDRGGRVLSVNLVRSSGSTLLDDEAVALVHRAEPLPSLPDEMPGSTITLTVPISFALR